MKTKKKKSGAALVLAAALSFNMQTVTPLAASDVPETVQENTQTDTSAENQEPAMPESYEWEIQSNNIAGWPQGPKIIAETGILMDLDTGEILYAKGIDEKRAPASITKIMTAMLAIEKVPLDTEITFTDEVNNIEPGSTHIGIKPGETLSMEESLYGILLGSANEVSSGVAEYIGGTVQAFVDMMNQRAQELGSRIPILSMPMACMPMTTIPQPETWLSSPRLHFRMKLSGILSKPHTISFPPQILQRKSAGSTIIIR